MTQVECPLRDNAKCQFDSSLELSGDRGIVQVTCLTCGLGKALPLPLAQAEELHAEIHAHREPPKKAGADAERPPTPVEPRKPSGQLR